MSFFLAANEAVPGLNHGMTSAKAGKSALSIIEDVIKPVERDSGIHSVGFGGWPNMLGEKVGENG